MDGLRDRFPAPALMAVVNVTPDSFSDGGRFGSATEAVEAALAALADGAAVVDVGGESTRPGAEPVSLDEEFRRVLPVIDGLRARTAAPISVDTSKAEVARRALDAGATMVNDVTALRDPDMAGVIALAGADVCVMHMRGTPRTMQDRPRYQDVVAEVSEWLAERVEAAVAAGVPRDRICVDPGIGFGKTPDQNLALIAAAGRIDDVAGAPVLIGVSRKRFLGRVLGDPRRSRTVGTVAAGLEAVDRGAWMLRVHDVGDHRDALRVRQAVHAAENRSRRALEVAVDGIAVFAFHGALEAERTLGQRFFIDLRLTPRSDRACDSDALTDAVHYGEVTLRVVELAQAGPHALLERVADSIAVALLAEFPLRAVSVRIRKPSAPVPALLDSVAVTVTRRAR